ncbi:hypothetical protein [Sphingobacterium siyangense]|uniref:hypothetical protein n=1 Tax=Sphingobacterium siyangense TaxID=459529 RepID=UPI002FDDAEDE
MKTIILALFALMVSGVVQGQEGYDDFTAHSKKMGLIAYLTQVKYVSELKMSELVNNPEYAKQTAKVKEFNQTYNLLKINIDMLINQISADLYRNNGLKVYSKINNHIKEGKKLSQKYESYESSLQYIGGFAEALMSKDYSNKSGLSLTDILSIGKFVFDVVKLEQENQQNKVENIINVLSQLKLKSSIDLKEDKKEKDKTDKKQ